MEQFIGNKWFYSGSILLLSSCGRTRWPPPDVHTARDRSKGEFLVVFTTHHVLILQGAVVCVGNADSRGLEPAECECTCSVADPCPR